MSYEMETNKQGPNQKQNSQYNQHVHADEILKMECFNMGCM